MSSFPPILSGPIPLYNNVPIEPQNYMPSRFVISAVVLGENTLVTTSVPHNYVIGQLCRVLIPKGYGCVQIDQELGLVLSIPNPNEVLLMLDSVVSNQFIAASLSQQPQILAVGDINNGTVNLTPTTSNPYIEGSFINISPNG